VVVEVDGEVEVVVGRLVVVVVVGGGGVVVVLPGKELVVDDAIESWAVVVVAFPWFWIAVV
jgi:hypothetical protein